MKSWMIALAILGSTVSTNLLVVNYQCLVSEETGESQQIGTMKVDTQGTDVSFVAIDNYLFAACKGLKNGDKPENQVTFLLCAYIVDDGKDGKAKLLENFSKVKSISGKDATDTRSVSLVLENAGFVLHTYKRNARTFQLACQASS